MEQCLLARVYDIDDPSEIADPRYIEGLRDAVHEGIDYGLAAVEHGQSEPPGIPAGLLEEAREAARLGVGLDTVLRRYFAGYALLTDFVMGAAEEDGLLGAGALQSLLRTQTEHFDVLIGAVAEEHTREAERRARSADRRRSDLVERLLAGERVDDSSLDYPLDGHHVGLVTKGGMPAEAIQQVASALDRRVLVISPDSDGTWAWIGGRRETQREKLMSVLEDVLPPGEPVAVGEPGIGLSGWRRSHKQARAAFPVALRGQDPLVEYRDVAVLASALRDDLLAASLRDLYLVPLTGERDGGQAWRQTLRAYIAAEGNVSSAAASLRVSRRTVTNRLRMIEETLERPIGPAIADIDAALRLHELG